MRGWDDRQAFRGDRGLKRYHITGIFGEAENGKTTYMISDLNHQADSGQFYDEIYCNLRSACKTKIKFIDYRGLVNFRGKTENGVARSLIGLDQMHKYLDARQSNSIKNILTTQVFIESRQHGFDSDYTTWMKSAVDKRVRPFTNLYVLAQRGPRGFEYDRIDKESSSEDLVIMPWPAAQDLWRRFDSTELIEDPTIDEVIAEEYKKRNEMKAAGRRRELL